MAASFGVLRLGAQTLSATRGNGAMGNGQRVFFIAPLPPCLIASFPLPVEPCRQTHNAGRNGAVCIPVAVYFPTFGLLSVALLVPVNVIAAFKLVNCTELKRLKT